MARTRGRDPRTAGRSAPPARCTGARGVSRTWWWKKQGDEIILDPHVTGECVMILDEDAARVLFEALEEWLG
ncbi:MAG: hypothetical protein ACRDR6_03175 [Pseudonocardiaceae bacterium]